MKKIHLFLLILGIAMISCDNDDQQNLNALIDCIEDQTITCPSEQAQISLCFYCAICKDDPNFSDYRFLDIIVESLPIRGGQSIGFVELDDNYFARINVCADIIEGQQSQVIGFGLAKGLKPTSIDYIFYDNIELNENQITYMNKEISPTNLEELNNCNKVPEILFDKDPNAEENKDFSFTVCIIGSYDWCYSSSPMSMSSVPWEEVEAGIINTYQEEQAIVKNILPCTDLFITVND